MTQRFLQEIVGLHFRLKKTAKADFFKADKLFKNVETERLTFNQLVFGWRAKKPGQKKVKPWKLRLFLEMVLNTNED